MASGGRYSARDVLNLHPRTLKREHSKMLHSTIITVIMYVYLHKHCTLPTGEGRHHAQSQDQLRHDTR